MAEEVEAPRPGESGPIRLDELSVVTGRVPAAFWGAIDGVEEPDRPFEVPRWAFWPRLPGEPWLELAGAGAGAAAGADAGRLGAETAAGGGAVGAETEAAVAGGPEWVALRELASLRELACPVP